MLPSMLLEQVVEVPLSMADRNISVYVGMGVEKGDKLGRDRGSFARIEEDSRADLLQEADKSVCPGS